MSMISRHIICLFISVFSLSGMLFGQVDETIQIDPNVQEYLENIVENTDAEFDFNAIYDRLNRYQKRPMNLNKVSAEELGELGLISSRQIDALLQYRDQVGNLIAIYELQAIPYFDLATIERILPYVKVGAQVERFNVPFYKMMYQGDNQLVVRMSRILEEKRGFSPREDSADTRYEGDEYRIFTRFKHTFENRHSWGITAEKDAGESFFQGSNNQGFDFYSAHLYYRNLGNTVKAIALGDYEVRFGQGLLLSGGFSTGKSSFVTNIKRSGRKVRPYTSVNEAIYLRGGATQLQFGEHFNFVAFASLRQRDANIAAIDTLENFEQIAAFTSLQLSGLHRTPSEIEDKNAIQQFTTGASLEWKYRQSHIAANFVYTEFDAAFNRNVQPFNQFQFNSGELIGGSLDYSVLWRNINFFGETAISDNGGIATTNGALIGLDRKIDLAILYRNFSRDFQTLFGDPFAETIGGSNEAGLYLGLDIKPSYNWQFSAYFDTWSHPWLRFGIDAPSQGYEYLAQAKYRIKRKLEVYFRYRDEFRERNVPNNETNIDVLALERRTQLRLNFSYTVTKGLDLRNRIEVILFQEENAPMSKGFMAYQDVIAKPVGFPISFTARFAIFDTDSFDSRIYAFENDILYSFTIPAFANRGMRYYLNLRYRPTRALTLEFRIAQTYLSNQDFIGSGLEQIDGNTRTEFKAQAQYKF